MFNGHYIADYGICQADHLTGTILPIRPAYAVLPEEYCLLFYTGMPA
jgi:hypothetical protein